MGDAKSATLPGSFTFEDKVIPCWTFEQLDRLGKANLKARALNLRDQLGAERLPILRSGSQPAELISWLLTAQVVIGKALGTETTLTDWGMPSEIEQESEPYFGRHEPPAKQRLPMPPPPAAVGGLPVMPPPPPPSHPFQPVTPPYGHDTAVSPRRTAPLPGFDALSDRAYEEARAGALSARMRNTGTLVLGDDSSTLGAAAASRPSSSRGGGPPLGGYQHYELEQQRPGSAQSIQAYEDSSNAMFSNLTKNRGSFIFG